MRGKKQSDLQIHCIRHWSVLCRVFGIANLLIRCYLAAIQSAESHVSFGCIRREGAHDKRRWVIRIFYALTRWSGITVEMRNKHLIDNVEGPCVLVANHQSSIDLIGLSFGVYNWYEKEMNPFAGFCYMWPEERGACLIKKSLLYAGFVGFSAKLCGSVFIDRFNASNARVTMNSARNEIVSRRVRIYSATQKLPFMHYS